jgi:hypothetical protein
MNQQVRVLNACYKNAAVGVDAITHILPKTTHPNLQEELSKQLHYYKAQKCQVKKALCSLGCVPEEQGELAKFCTNMSIQMHCFPNAGNSEIAKLMIKGTNEGILQLTEVFHRNTEIPDQLKRQGKEILHHEEAYLNRLKAYL